MVGDADTPLGCGSLIVAVVVIGIVGTIIFEVCSPPSTCEVMQEVEYDYHRYAELDNAHVHGHKLKYYYENVSPRPAGLKLYCEDKDKFWGSKYDIYP